MDNDRRLNFISSIVITLLSVGILAGCVHIYFEASVPLHVSPALMPGLLGAVLLLASLLMMRQSIRGDGLRIRLVEAKASFGDLIREPSTRTTVIGIGLMAIYTFGLLRWLPFWAASLIFTVVMLAFLRAARWWMVLIISGSLIGAIVLLFSVIFRVPLP